MLSQIRESTDSEKVAAAPSKRETRQNAGCFDFDGLSCGGIPGCFDFDGLCCGGSNEAEDPEASERKRLTPAPSGAVISAAQHSVGLGHRMVCRPWGHALVQAGPGTELVLHRSGYGGARWSAPSSRVNRIS